MKTEQERIDYLANRIREFNIQVSGGGLIDGGFGKLPPIGQGDITIEHLEQAFSEFRLTGNNGIQAHGSLQNGYLLFGNPPTAGPEGFAPVVPIVPIPPVTQTGACCVGDTCSITTETGCPGVYHGDGSTCEDVSCVVCDCYFDGFLGHRRYTTASSSTEGSYNNPTVNGGQTASFNGSSTTHISGDGPCDVTCSAFSGSGTSSQVGDETHDPCSGSWAVDSCFAEDCLCGGNCSFSGIMVSTAPDGTGGYLGWSYSGSPGCEFLCSNNTPFWNLILTVTTISDTVQQRVWDTGDGIIFITQTITLSDECPSPMGACCDGSGCSITTSEECADMDDEYQGDGSTCSPNPCLPTGACCVDTDCSVVTESSCEDSGATYQGDDTDCSPNPCSGPTGACCFGSSCADDFTEADCVGFGGTYQGDGTICFGHPCP